MTILYCATFKVNGVPVEFKEYIMIYGPRDLLLEAVYFLVKTLLEHPYYQKVLDEPNNKISLNNITGIIIGSKEHLTQDERNYLKKYFLLVFERERAKYAIALKERLVS